MQKAAKSKGKAGATRIERDPLGEKGVPADALYGIQTFRALENFQISALRIHPEFIRAYAEIKKAAAEANIETGKLESKIGKAIIKAADEIIDRKLDARFDLDVFQAGAGTSYNMNLNEVIANRALEMLGEKRGDYAKINPNDDVNKSQSTNDTMPTAIRITALRLLRGLRAQLDKLTDSFRQKAKEFAAVEKSGRTHLHDAVPMTLGEEFGGYAENLHRATKRLEAQEEFLLEIPLGGTAVGTGLNAHPDYAEIAVKKLSRITNLDLREAKNKIQSQQSLGDFLAVSSALKNYCVEISKICNDLRLLNSGPHTGIYEIELPAQQPGSSIMPGKVNPAMAEMVNMVCFHIIGKDSAIAMCAEAGQLELNVMMPYAAYALFECLDILTKAVKTFDEKCVRDIKAHPEICRQFAERSVGQAARLNEERGFMGAAEIAMRAVEENKSVQEIVGEENLNK
ncbi:MAG TPA: aspartate ammonia-lyase [Pyrinomonadaceae bacterium]|jgi:aspartate ammonia-lyase